MKQLNNYIFEKLKLDKNIKIQKISELDPNNIDMVEAIVKAVFISIFKNNSYKSAFTTYILKRSKINWTDVVEILDEMYGYKLDPEDALKKNGNLQSFIRPHFKSIENLINMKKIKIKTDSEEKLLKGIDLYWNDWKTYFKQHNIT